MTQQRNKNCIGIQVSNSLYMCILCVYHLLLIDILTRNSIMQKSNELFTFEIVLDPKSRIIKSLKLAFSQCPHSFACCATFCPQILSSLNLFPVQKTVNDQRLLLNHNDATGLYIYLYLLLWALCSGYIE